MSSCITITVSCSSYRPLLELTNPQEKDTTLNASGRDEQKGKL